MKISLDVLSQFAFSMATCLASGMLPRKALELSGAAAPSAALRMAVRAAADASDQGNALSDGLELHARHFPPFVIPVIRAGEMSGRHVEAFRLIHDHCERLKPTLKLVRNTWLYPLICILFGWVIRTGLLLYFGLTEAAWLLVRDTFLTTSAFVLITWALFQVRLVKEMMDICVLQIPLVRETLIRLSVTLFFATFRLGYESGGVGVLTVFDVALATVRNTAVRKDFLKARSVLEEQGSFEEAFGEPTLLEDDIKSSITAGALSGHLGSSLDQIVRRETLELEGTLTRFNRLFQMLIAYGVAMSIVGTLLMCLFSSPAR